MFASRQRHTHRSDASIQTDRSRGLSLATRAMGMALPATTALNVFDGLDPDGTWQLYVVDDANLQTGQITGGWELEITAKVKQEKKDKGGHGKGHGKKTGRRD